MGRTTMPAPRNMSTICCRGTTYPVPVVLPSSHEVIMNWERDSSTSSDTVCHEFCSPVSTDTYRSRSGYAAWFSVWYTTATCGPAGSSAAAVTERSTSIPTIAVESITIPAVDSASVTSEVSTPHSPSGDVPEPPSVTKKSNENSTGIRSPCSSTPGYCTTPSLGIAAPTTTVASDPVIEAAPAAVALAMLGIGHLLAGKMCGATG